MSPEKPSENNRDYSIVPAKKQESTPEVSIYSPDIHDLSEQRVEDLHGHWRENHARIVQSLQMLQPPFFGFHGTSQNHTRVLWTQNAVILK